jgi:Ricin-type beta-trefoil lectin domain
MGSYRRLVISLAALTLIAGGSATAWLTRAGAAVAPSAKPAPPGVQPNGVNFAIHSHVDPNFCVEGTPAPQEPASGARMAQCAQIDTQHWTFAHAADGSVVIIGGSVANCLDFSAKAPSPVSVTPCTFKGAERFFYAPTGLIESTSGKKCLEPAAAALNATISIVKCNANVAAQIWVIGH